MTEVNLTPNGTTSNTGTVTGGGGVASTVLSDGSDSTYVVYTAGQLSKVTLTDLTLPAGALLVGAAEMARCKRNSAITSAVIRGTLYADITVTADLTINWTSPTLVTVFGSFGPFSDAGMDAASIDVGSAYSSALTVYEAYVLVTYLLQPVVTVSAPTGTVADNSPTVTWSTVYDPDLGVPPGSNYEVKIFSSAQYSAGGFNPETSTPTLTSGPLTATGTVTSYEFTSLLANGVYRAYVKQAASNVSYHPSAWAYSGFTVSASKPGTPTVTLTPDSASSKMLVAIVHSAGAATTNRFQVQRSDDGGASYQNIRTPLANGFIIANGTSDAFLYDYEMPMDYPVYYRARALTDATQAYGDWGYTVPGGTITAATWWIKHPTLPAMNLPINLRSYPDASNQSNQGAFRPLGSSLPVIVSDNSGPLTGTIAILCEDQNDRDLLDTLLEQKVPMLLQGPRDHEIPDRWVVFGDHKSTRLLDSAVLSKSDESLDWTLVARPLDVLP